MSKESDSKRDGGCSPTACSADFDFRHHLYDTLILLGAPLEIAEMLKKSEDFGVTETDIDILRNFNCRMIDGLKTRLVSINTVSVRSKGAGDSMCDCDEHD